MTDNHYQYLKKAASKAAADLASDTTVPRSETRAALRALAEEVRVSLDELDQDTGEDVLGLAK